VIYDFIDTHETFRRQWVKRRAFYRKQKYQIVSFGLEVDQEDSLEDADEDQEEDPNKGKCLIKLRK
jgi:hypothetical protein